ncbi:YrzI family small protein [Halalkalibacter okhensis]|nr:YrzI family small protein [Halalkalibacter okhensis]
MTFHFILFTITIKKRQYTGKQLEQMVRQQNYSQEHQERMARIEKWK